MFAEEVGGFLSAFKRPNLSVFNHYEPSQSHPCQQVDEFLGPGANTFKFVLFHALCSAAILLLGHLAKEARIYSRLGDQCLPILNRAVDAESAEPVKSRNAACPKTPLPALKN